MKELTKRQEETLDYIRDFIDQHNYPPTIRELAASFQISVKGAYDHIKALEKKAGSNATETGPERLKSSTKNTRKNLRICRSPSLDA